MVKRWQALLLILAILAGILFWKREPLMLAWVAAKTEQTSLDQRIDLIRDNIEVRLPDEGAPPYPVILQFHGCAGIRPPFQEQWADIANRAGYAAVIVDSNGPRGFSREEALDVVCGGKALIGQERAGDVAAAIKIAQSDVRLDASHLVLAGWSHGGWSVMDFLTMDGKTRKPAGLSGWNGDQAAVAGAILFYPYCGPGALSRFRNWTKSPKTLAFVAGADEMVDAQECLSYFEARQSKEDAFDLVFYEDAHHVFDDPFLEPEWIHWYNEDYFNDAARRYEAFLEDLN